MKATSGFTAGSSKGENRPLEDNSEKTVKPRISSISRRSFLGKSLAVGAGTIGVGLLGGNRTARASRGGLTPGDAALLRFLATAEFRLILRHAPFRARVTFYSVRSAAIPGWET